MRIWGPASLALFASTPGVTQEVVLEYVAHAAVIVASGETRVLVDPYNGSRWMGFAFPRSLDVDAVLLTHPHYDHDAAYYAGADTPVFREPGRYRIGGIEFIGVEAEHAGGSRYRQRGITPYNVIWTIEAGGLRFTHVGDNRVLTETERLAVGSTDVLFVPPFHDIDAALEEAGAMGASVVVPIHYRLPSMAAEGYGLPTVDDWLDGREAVRPGTHRINYARGSLPTRLTVHVPLPHPDVQSWREELTHAWALYEQAMVLGSSRREADAVPLLERAIMAAPEVMSFPLALGELLTSLERDEDAERVYVEALAIAVEGDIEPTLRIRGRLAKRYALTGRSASARLLYRAILGVGRSYAADVVDEARVFLSH